MPHAKEAAKPKDPFRNFGPNRLAVMTARSNPEDQLDNGTDLPDLACLLMKHVDGLPGAIEAAVMTIPMPESLRQQATEYLQDLARQAAQELPPRSRARATALLNQDHEAAARLRAHADQNGLELKVETGRHGCVATIGDLPVSQGPGPSNGLVITAGHGRDHQEALTDLAWRASGRTMCSPFHDTRHTIPDLTGHDAGPAA